MTEQPTIWTEPTRKRYASHLVSMLRLWRDARQAAHHDDSIFIWIPKNAGSSVYEVLRTHGLVKLKTLGAARHCFRNAGRVTFGHMDIGALVDAGIVDREFVDGAFKFAVTRDPYARAVSLYRYLLAHVMLNWRENPTFGDFLRLLADGRFDRIGLYNSRGLSQCNPQVEWLRRNWPEKTYKVEKLDEFISDIRDRWGIPISEVPHMNYSTGASIELAREEQALIEQVYAEDFEALGYRKRKSAISMAQM